MSSEEKYTFLIDEESRGTRIDRVLSLLLAESSRSYIQKKKEKLHLLMGLKKILLDIDYAIQIIRETEEEAEVVPNLMVGFGIDEVQAEYVEEINSQCMKRNEYNFTGFSI